MTLKCSYCGSEVVPDVDSGAMVCDCIASNEPDDERDDSPYCDCGNIPTEEEDAFNRCSCCGKRLDP